MTASEWNVLSCLWENSPRTAMQLVATLEEAVGWAKTILHRMEAKGLIHCEQTGKSKTYTPIVDREQATVAETRSFLDRVYQGSVGLMMSAMAERQELTAEEISQLKKIPEKMGGEKARQKKLCKSKQATVKGTGANRGSARAG